MRILFLGSCQSVFLSELASHIKRHSPSTSLNVANLRTPGGDPSELDKRAFDDLFELPAFKPTEFSFSFKDLIDAIKGYKSVTSTFTLIRNTLLFRWSSITKIGWKKHEENRDIASKSGQIQQYDVVNLHNLTDANLKFLKYVDTKKQKVILSFWGSDLMREHEPRILKLQYEALLKADKITVQNTDLKFLICSKFGWHLSDKIHCTTFIPNDRLLHLISTTAKADAKTSLGRKFSLDPNRTWIILGYQTIESMQVLLALKSIVSCESFDKSKPLAFVFPSTYKKIDPDYLNEIKSICERHGFGYYFIEHYLSEEEMAFLRKATDIYVHMPISDAYSFTLVEHLYGGNQVVTGSWLPYSNLRLNGIKYDEVEQAEHVGEIIGKLLKGSNSIDQTHSLDRLFSPEKLALQWINILTN